MAQPPKSTWKALDRPPPRGLITAIGWGLALGALPHALWLLAGLGAFALLPIIWPVSAIAAGIHITSRRPRRTWILLALSAAVAGIVYCSLLIVLGFVSPVDLAIKSMWWFVLAAVVTLTFLGIGWIVCPWLLPRVRPESQGSQ